MSAENSTIRYTKGMKFVTQFNQGEWWQSEDGRTWKRLYGTTARQLNNGLGLLEAAMVDLASEGEDIITVQLQLVNPKLRKKQPAPKKFAKDGPITTGEIAEFYNWFSKNKRIVPDKNK